MTDDQLEKEQQLIELNQVIQICHRCGKVDAYKGDEHICDPEYRNRMEQDYDQSRA